jgi:hypothetical protein
MDRLTPGAKVPILEREGGAVNITLEITPQVQAELARQAAITARGPETHAATLLEEALRLSPSEQTPSHGGKPPFGKILIDVFATARVLLAGEELDFSRDPSPGRSVDLS